MHGMFTTNRHGLLLACLLGLLSLVSGCSSSDRLVPEPVVHTPLDIDPTEDIELPAWWVGSDRLIHLGPSGVYTVHANQNRFTPPLERGRWDRTAYLVIRLAPYEPVHALPTELRLAMRSGVLCAQRPGEELLRSSVTPPTVPEDLLVGRWRSETGLLDLAADLTFVMHPRRDLDPEKKPRAFMREHGTWIYQNGMLVLSRVTPERQIRTIEVHDLVPALQEAANGGSMETAARPWIVVDDQRFTRESGQAGAVASSPR